MRPARWPGCAPRCGTSPPVGRPWSWWAACRPARYTIALADDLAWAAVSEDTLLVRQAFGRLPRSEVEGIVPAAVWRKLGDSPDAEAYRRFAELLDHLGLDYALRELCEAALSSADEGIREVGEDFLVLVARLGEPDLPVPAGTSSGSESP